MTTALAQNTPADVLVALRAAYDALPERDDLPGTMTDRQKDEHEAQRSKMAALVSSWPAWRLERPVARRAALQSSLDRLLIARDSLREEIENSPDWRTVADPRARDAEWERQQAVLASLTALDAGVNFFDGRPALPGPLRAILTPPPCAACGRPHEVEWPGTIPDLEAEIEKLDREIETAEAHLASAVAAARALLAS